MTAYIFKIISLLGGLALFLFGMDIMGKALERQAGGKLQTILAKMSGKVWKGFLLGMAVTAVIQSSSATTVMVVGFVNSGIMTLQQAVGVIMGSNVGTTVTAWILSLSGLEGDSFLIQMFKPSTLAPLIGVIGIFLYMGKSEKKKGIGTIMLGFMALMTGMDLMSKSMSFLKTEAWFADLMISFTNPLVGILFGAVLTAIIQSSSASVGILQGLCVTGAVTYGAAIPFTGSRAKTRSGCYCNGGWLTHNDGSAQYLISRPGIYMVSVGAQVTSAVAASVATLAITTNGKALAGTTMAETITAADDVAQLATTALLTVPCGASITVALTNAGDADITVNAASLVLTRVA